MSKNGNKSPILTLLPIAQNVHKSTKNPVANSQNDSVVRGDMAKTCLQEVQHVVAENFPYFDRTDAAVTELIATSQKMLETLLKIDAGVSKTLELLIFVYSTLSELALKENVTKKYSVKKFRNIKLEKDQLFLNPISQKFEMVDSIRNHNNVSENNITNNSSVVKIDNECIQEIDEQDECQNESDEIDSSANNKKPKPKPGNCIMPMNDDKNKKGEESNALKKTQTKSPIAYSENSTQNDFIGSNEISGNQHPKQNNNNKANEIQTEIKLLENNLALLTIEKKVETYPQLLASINNDKEYKSQSTEGKIFMEALRNIKNQQQLADAMNMTSSDLMNNECQNKSKKIDSSANDKESELKTHEYFVPLHDDKNKKEEEPNEIQAFIKLPEDNKIEKTCSKILVHVDNDQEYKMPSREEKTFMEALKNTKSSRQQLTVLAGAINATPDLIRSCIKEIGIYEHRLTEPDIKVLSQTVLLRSKLEELALRSCKMNPKHLELLLEQTRNTKCKIKKFTVSNIDGIESLVPSICKSISVYKSEILCIENDELEDDVVNKLEKCLADEKITHMNELDVSYNKNISEGAYKTMGKILRKCGSKTFKAVDCDVDSNKLKKFSEGLGAAELDELDVSCNEDMKDEAFETIAGLVGTNKVKHLKLSSCGLTKRRFNRFRRFNSDKAKLFELDVSYNPFMNRRTFKALGKTVKQYQVEKLSLAGCKLGRMQVKLFRIFAGEHQMDAMDVRDNFRIGEGIIEIANIVVDCKLKDLDISECMLSPYQVRRFKKALGYGKLRCLNLSDKERVATESHIRAICELLPNIDEELHVRFNKFDESLKSILQEELNNLSKTNMKIILNDGCMKQQKQQRKD
ncbi:uncharacterized protein LOC120329415 isoform X2 [Styela clava]